MSGFQIPIVHHFLKSRGQVHLIAPPHLIDPHAWPFKLIKSRLEQIPEQTDREQMCIRPKTSGGGDGSNAGCTRHREPCSCSSRLRSRRCCCALQCWRWGWPRAGSGLGWGRTRGWGPGAPERSVPCRARRAGCVTTSVNGKLNQTGVKRWLAEEVTWKKYSLHADWQPCSKVPVWVVKFKSA